MGRRPAGGRSRCRRRCRRAGLLETEETQRPPAGEAEEPQALPLEEQGEEAPDGDAPGEAASPEETEPAVEPAADTETNEAEEASHDE